MFLPYVSQEEIDRVIDYPLPTHTYPFDASALRALVAESFSILEEEELSMIEGFSRMTADQATGLIRIFESERSAIAALTDRHARLLRSTFHVVR